MMLSDEMSASNSLFMVLVRIGQWPHTRISVENVTSAQVCTGKDAVRFIEKVIDFPTFNSYVIGIIFKTNICCPDQIIAVPGNDEEWPPVYFRFNIDCGRTGLGERRNDYVTAFGSTDQPFNASGFTAFENAIDPGTCCVHEESTVHDLRLGGCLKINRNDLVFFR